MGVIIYNRETYEIVAACPTVPEEFGYTRNELIGMDRRNLGGNSSLEAVDDCGFAFGKMDYTLASGERQERFFRQMRIDAGSQSFIVEDSFTLSNQATLFGAWLSDIPDLRRVVSESLRAADFTLNQDSHRTLLH